MTLAEFTSIVGASPEAVVLLEGGRKSARYANAVYDSPETLSSVRDDEVAYKTAKASPKNKDLIEKRDKKGAGVS